MNRKGQEAHGQQASNDSHTKMPGNVNDNPDNIRQFWQPSRGQKALRVIVFGKYEIIMK